MPKSFPAEPARSPGRASSISLGLLALLFAAAGLLHFLRPDGYVSIVPHFLPAPRALVFACGACEVLLGLGLLWPRARAAAGIGPITLWLRLPLQAVLAWWVFRVAIARRYPLESR